MTKREQINHFAETARNRITVVNETIWAKAKNSFMKSSYVRLLLRSKHPFNGEEVCLKMYATYSDIFFGSREESRLVLQSKKERNSLF